MRKTNKIVSLLLAVVMVVSCVTAITAVSVSAAEGFTVTATSNFFPEREETFGSVSEGDHITVSYYIQSSQMMVNSQWNLYFDPEVLKYCEDDGVNQTGEYWYDEDTGENELLGYDYNIAPVTDPYGAVINTEKVSRGEIHGNNSSPNPVYKLKTDDGKKIGFITVTFEVLDPTKDTEVNLEVVEMMTNKGQIYKFSAPVAEDSMDGFELQSSVYEGNYDPDYENQEPSTEEPTTEAPTEEATTEAPTTEEPTEEATTEEPAPADTYTVAGSSAGMFGSTWDADNTANDMTFNAETGLYEITYPEVAPDNGIQLKVLENHNWDTSYGDPNTGDNYTFNVTDTCDVTVTIDPETKIVNVTGEYVTQDTELDVYSVIAVGNGEDTYLNGVNWDPSDTSNAMEEVADGIWEITYVDIYAFDNYQIKFALNSVDENGDPTSNPWANNFGIEVEELVETGTEIPAVWNGKNCLFEVEEDESWVTFQLDLRDFDFVTKQGAKFTITVETPVPTEPTTVPEEPTTEAPTEEATTEEPEVTDTYTVAGSSAAMFGSTWDATNEANDMTFNEATGLFEITYSDVQPDNGIQLKVVKNHSWDEAWGDPNTGDNYTFNVVEPCDVTVTFDPAEQIVNVTGDGVTQDSSLDVYSVIAVGNGEDTYLNGVNWDPSDTSNAMEEVADGIWEMTMEDIYAFDNYQIKFAINSIDENGDPTSNPWAHNFGVDVEELKPVGEAIDAVYNGKNCLFEVEEDESVVKFQLDLRDFDFVTKQGAKFTITVTPPEPEEPTTEAPTEEPTTEAPTEEPTTEAPTEEPTTEAPTEAPTDPTPAVKIGDVNGDGSVDVLDATMIKKYAVDKITLTDAQIDAADVNGDGSVDVLDATLIEKYAVEKISKFPREQ